jgi:hypothetical protein
MLIMMKDDGTYKQRRAHRHHTRRNELLAAVPREVILPLPPTSGRGERPVPASGRPSTIGPSFIHESDNSKVWSLAITLKMVILVFEAISLVDFVDFVDFVVRPKAETPQDIYGCLPTEPAKCASSPPWMAE